MILLALAASWPAPAGGQPAPPSDQPPIPYGLDTSGRACILAGSSLKAGAVAFTPDGSTLFIGYEDGSIRRHDARTGRQLGPTIQTQRYPIRCLAISADGQGIAIASSWPNSTPPQDVVTIRRPVEAEIGEFPPIPGRVIALAYAADGKTIGAIDHMYNIRVWRVEDRSEVARSEDRLRADGRRPEAAETRASFSADLKRAVIVNDSDARFKEGRWNHLVRLWEAGSKEQRIYGDQGGFEAQPITSALISPDGSRFVVAHELQSVFVHDFVSGRILHTRIPGAQPRTIEFTFLMLSPDNRRLISATKERSYLIMKLDDELHGGARFSGPRGHVRPAAFVSSRGPIRPAEFVYPRGHIRAAVFVPKGVRFATGGWDPLGAELIPGTAWPKHEPVILWEVALEEK